MASVKKLLQSPLCNKGRLKKLRKLKKNVTLQNTTNGTMKRFNIQRKGHPLDTRYLI